MVIYSLAKVIHARSIRLSWLSGYPRLLEGYPESMSRLQERPSFIERERERVGEGHAHNNRTSQFAKRERVEKHIITHNFRLTALILT